MIRRTALVLTVLMNLMMPDRVIADAAPAVRMPTGFDLARLRRRASDPAWRAAMQALQRDADVLVKRGAMIPGPDPESGWYHDYVCPTCAQRLEFSLGSPRSHRCGACAQTYEGPQLDEAWVSAFNRWQMQAAWSATLVAAATQDAKLAALARDVVLGYARMYPQYREHGKHAGIGRLGGQSLDEAVWMCDAAAAVDVLRTIGAMSEADVREVGERMFVPAIALLRRQTKAVHNIHVWHASAIYAMGLIVGDADAVVFAEDHIARNLREGLHPDGLWFEISSGYHYYTLSALEHYARAALRHGRQVVQPQAFARMYKAPLALVLPDGTLPPFNDNGSTRLASKADAYELGHYLFGGLDGALTALYAGDLSRRRGELALLYGLDEVGADGTTLPRLTTVDGIAVSRRDHFVALLKATPYAGWHDHSDRLSLNLYPHGPGVVAAEAGNPNYGHPLHAGFFKRTMAHNTLLVDGKDQRTADARVLLAEDAGAASIIAAAADEAYPGVELTRTCVFGEGWVLDWFTAASEVPHAYTWRMHARGDLAVPQAWPAQPWIDHPQMTRQRKATVGDEQVTLTWSPRADEGQALHLALRVRGKQRWVGAAQAPDLPLTRHVDVVAAGGEGVAWEALALWSAAPRALDATPTTEGGWRVAIGGPHGMTLTLAPRGRVILHPKASR